MFGSDVELWKIEWKYCVSIQWIKVLNWGNIVGFNDGFKILEYVVVIRRSIGIDEMQFKVLQLFSYLDFVLETVFSVEAIIFETWWVGWHLNLRWNVLRWLIQCFISVSYCMYFYQHIGKSTCISVHASLDSSYDYAIFAYRQLVESN